MVDEVYLLAAPRMVLREESERHGVLFDPHTGAGCEVNRVGMLIWKLMDGRSTPRQIADRLRHLCRNVPGELERQTGDFISQLIRRGYAETLSAPAARAGSPSGETICGAECAPGEIMSTPRSMDIAVTARCNLRCAYCSHFSSAGDVKEELATADWLQFFEELGRCGVMTVVLQGGEPFCRSDLPDLIRGIVANRMRFSILSNGTLITEELAALLSTSGRCEGVQVSLDGSVSEVHDAFRGAGSFAAALAGIRRLQRNEVPVTVRATLHRHNIDDLQSLAQLLLEDLGIPEFSTNAAAFMGLCRRNSEAVQLTVAGRSRAMQTLLNLSQKYPGRISANAGPLADARRWSLMEQARRGGRETLPGGGYLTGCNCTTTTLAARADGTLVPCLQMGHLALGRLDRDRLPVLWQHHPVLNTLRNRHRISLENFRDCFDCPYRSFCTGNCPALAHQITGDIERPSPDACLRLFLDQGGVLPESAAPDS